MFLFCFFVCFSFGCLLLLSSFGGVQGYEGGEGGGVGGRGQGFILFIRCCFRFFGCLISSQFKFLEFLVYPLLVKEN